MIHLEPADAGLGVPQRTAVIAGRAHHDLPHAAADGGHHYPVEERRASGQVVMHPVQRRLASGGDLGGQSVVSGGIAVGRGNPGESETVRRHPLSGYRWTAVFHVSSTALFRRHRLILPRGTVSGGVLAARLLRAAVGHPGPGRGGFPCADVGG